MLPDASPRTRSRAKLRAADLFAGAGGASTGLTLAAAAADIDLDLVAVNHWDAAVKTHAANHPAARHLCEAIERVDPRDAVPGGRLDLLVAGPECTFFSTARGGRPIDDQRRSSAWSILRWLELLRVDHVLIENVPEFASWGPLNARGRPMKSRRGEVFRAYIAAIESMNYRVEYKVLNSADFGEATTRKRLFIQAARRRGRIAWPEPTHSRSGESTLLRHTKRWRPARDIIDWNLPSRSIFNRERPLSRNTLRRIQTGLARFGGRPFVLGQHGGSAPRAAELPIPTVTADGAISVVEPFLVEYHGERPGERPRVRDLDHPLPTQTTENRFGLVEVEVEAESRGPQCTPFLVPLYGERKGQRPRTHSIDEPVPTIPASGGGKFGLVQLSARGGLPHVEPFTLPYCSNGGQLARPVSQPVGTITTHDRFALVIPDGVDVRYRLLQPRELAAAMGFPSDYRFIGTKTDTIRMIGNAWSCRISEALCACILQQRTMDRTRVA